MEDRPCGSVRSPRDLCIGRRVRDLPTTSLSWPQNPTSQNCKQPIGSLKLFLPPILLEIQLSKNRQRLTWAMHSRLPASRTFGRQHLRVYVKLLSAAAKVMVGSFIRNAFGLRMYVRGV